MNLYTIAAIMMCGITVYVGLSHLLLCRKHMWRRHHFLFSLLCLVVAAYDMFAAGLYNSTSVSDGMQWQRAQFVAISLMALLLIWFVHDYSSRRRKRTIYIFILFYLLMAFCGIVLPDSWLFTGNDAIKQFDLPVYGHAVFYEAEPGRLFYALGIGGLISTLYILSLAVRGFNNNRKEYFVLIISIMFFVAGIVNDVAVSMGLYQFMYLIEYSYLAMIILMAITLSDEINTSARTFMDLRALEERFRAVFKNSAVGIALVNTEKRITIANDAMGGMLGYPAEQLVDMLFLDCMPPDDADTVYPIVNEILMGERDSWRHELRYRQPGNKVYWGDMSFALVRDSAGEISGLLWIIVGITERRKAVESLKRLNEVLEQEVANRTIELERANNQLKRSLDILEQDEKAGRMLQFNLLPDEKMNIGNYYFERYLAPSLYLSGDFVDYFRIDDDNIGFYIADVSGHGVSSAFVTVFLQSFMKNSLANYKDGRNNLILDPAHLLARLNEALIAQNSGKHIVIFYGVISEKDNVITYTNGGQYPLPMLISGGKVEIINDPGSAVGLFEFSKYNNARRQLPEDFSIVIFSDGILEILSAGPLAEKQKYLEELVNTPDFDINKIIRQVDIDKRDALPDDITVLLIKRRLHHAAE